MTTLLQHAHSCGESINHIRQPTPYEQHVGARLLDFFSSRALWNRSLWTVGVVLALEEVLEAIVAQRDSHLGPPTMQEVTATAARLAEHDPGLGTQAFRNTLRGILLTNGAPRKELRFGGLDYATVQQINQEIQREYLDRWAAAITMPNPPRPERTARAIGSHMLDAGFFPDFLHRWWTLKLRYEQDTEKSLGDIVREASALVAIPAKHFKVLVTFHSPLQPSMKGVRPPSNWLTGEHVSKWLTEKQFDSHGLKQQGGLLLEVNAREPESAVQAALERTELFAARVLVTLRKEV